MFCWGHARREPVSEIRGGEVERVFRDFVMDAMMLDLAKTERSEPRKTCNRAIDDVALDMR